MNLQTKLRFWRWVHEKAEAFWHWVYYAKLQPLEKQQAFAEQVGRIASTPVYLADICYSETLAEKLAAADETGSVVVRSGYRIPLSVDTEEITIEEAKRRYPIPK